MKKHHRNIWLVILAPMLALTACSSPARFDDTTADRNNTKQGAIIGGLLGAGVGAIASDKPLKGAVLGGAIGAAGGAGVGSLLDKQEAELRQSLGNDDVTITNTGDSLIVTMPQDILFDVDSAVVGFAVRDDLSVVASSLQNYPSTNVRIIGHTDNSGGALHNQDLSQRRANSVADVLLDNGVAFERIQTTGRGEDQPIASNLTEEGKAQNRRVEIVIEENAV
ncbi:MAG: OmpA family protein [Pseudomonadota bacterium]